MFYLVKTPWVVKKVLYPEYVWSIPVSGKTVFLTFDDGPHPEATPFVLDELQRFNAKATFFCIGKNVAANPELYHRIISSGHRAGNHTQDHYNGWKVPDGTYLKSITDAAKYIDTSLFRPPYGRITGFQARQVIDKLHYDIIMWSVLSGDFDIGLSPEACWKNVMKAVRPGSIIVFHDSAKALKRLRYALPKTLECFSGKGYVFESISL
jgi:peptidoglycan/xylan/chitin deacetylase (PgdA/CDA1 family)